MTKSKSFKALKDVGARHRSEPDDLSNLEGYGEDELEQEAEALGGEVEAQSLGLLYDARHKFQVSEGGRDYQLHIAPTSRENLADSIRWIKEFVPPAARFNPGMSERIDPDALAFCPFDFSAGVWMEYQANILGVDQGGYARVASKFDWPKCLADLLKTDEAHWIKSARGDGHRKVIEAQSGPHDNEPAQDGPRPARISGVSKKPSRDHAATPADERGEAELADAGDYHYADEKKRDIYWLKYVVEERDGDDPLRYWVPYYKDDNGDPKSIGRIWTWHKVNEPHVDDQLRSIVNETDREQEDITKLAEGERFRAFYRLEEFGDKGYKAAKFHRLERLSEE